MKLRIHGDSIRLRLRKPDVQKLLETGVVIQTTAFSSESKFSYRLEIGGDAILATFSAGDLRVSVPRDQVRQWAGSDEVGLAIDQPVGNGKFLRILIEKDFACRDGGESQDGAFENPHPAPC